MWGQLAGRLPPNPRQVTSKAAERAAGRGRRGRTGGHRPPRPCSLTRGPSGSRGCLVPVTRSCVGSGRPPHMTLGVAGPAPKVGPWQPDSSLKSCSFLLSPSLGPRRQDGGLWWDSGRKAGSAGGEGEDSAAPLLGSELPVVRGVQVREGCKPGMPRRECPFS